MSEASIALAVMTFLIFLVFLGFLIWGIRTGQFKNIEEAKYVPLQEEGAGVDEGPSGGASAHGQDPDHKGGKKP